MIKPDNNPIETILIDFALKLDDAPCSGRLARLAWTARRLSKALIDDLAALIMQIDDTQFVGDDIAVHVIDVAFHDVRYSDARAFALALRTRLQAYVRDPCLASGARREFRECVASWKPALVALGRSADRRREAIVPMEACQNG